MPEFTEQIILNGEWYDEYDRALPVSTHDAAKSILKFLNSFEEEDFHKMIGVGIEVTITREGIVVRDF